MLMQEPTAEMINEWKHIYKQNKGILKPNKKASLEIIEYLKQHYSLIEIHDEKQNEIIIYNAKQYRQFDNEPIIKIFEVENKGFGKELYSRQDEIFKGMKIIVGVELETSFIFVEGSSFLYDKLYAYRGLDEEEINNYFLVAQYIQCKDKMSINDKIMRLMSFDNQDAYQALKELLVISEESNQVYPYFDKFVDMMNDKTNSYVRTRGLRLIAYNSKWDNENKMNVIIEQYLHHMEDEKPITSRQCIKDTVIIARDKPELIDIILDALGQVNKVYKDSMQNLIYKDRQKAIRQIKQYTW